MTSIRLQIKPTVNQEKRERRLGHSVTALIAGCTATLAFAPFHFYPLAVLAPAVLLILWLNGSTRQAVTDGLCFGIGFFGTGVSWVFVSIHQYGNTGIFLSLVITALFILILSLYLAIIAFLFKKLCDKNTLSTLIIGFPALWVIGEWMRSALFTGFPWLLLGFSQTDTPLSGFSPIIGVYGISLLVTMSAGLLVYPAMINRKALWRCLLTLFIIWGAGSVLHFYNWTRPVGSPIPVSLIQGNIPQELKWDPSYVTHTLETYTKLTDKSWDSKLIVWPEAAIPLPKAQAQGFINSISKVARKHGSTIISGLPVAAPEPDHFYNGLLAFGTSEGEYFKQHLVPFGEYLPLAHWLHGLIGFFNIPMSNFVAGPSQQKLLTIGDMKVAPFICYEVAYSDTVRAAMPRANALLTISDDAWFGHSFAQAQQLQMGQFRAEQTGRYMMFATNNGLTAIIGPHGRLLSQVPAFKEAVLSGYIAKVVGQTPWDRFGYHWMLVLCALMVIRILISNRLRD